MYNFSRNSFTARHNTNPFNVFVIYEIISNERSKGISPFHWKFGYSFRFFLYFLFFVSSFASVCWRGPSNYRNSLLHVSVMLFVCYACSNIQGTTAIKIIIHTINVTNQIIYISSIFKWIYLMKTEDVRKNGIYIASSNPKCLNRGYNGMESNIILFYFFFFTFFWYIVCLVRDAMKD